MGGDDDEITYYNPGGINIANENPDMYREITNLQGLREDFRKDSIYSLDPNRYNERMIDSGNRASVGVQNQMASYGMAGSSAAVGAGSEARRQNEFAWDDRRLNDKIKAMQLEATLSGQISGNIMGVQNQFGNTQNAVIQAQQAAAAQEAAMWGQIIGAVGTVGGAMLGGPAGAMIGGSLGGLAGGGGGGGAAPTPMYAGGDGGYSVGKANGMYGGNPSAYGYGGYY
jgi:hypothetical protein